MKPYIRSPPYSQLAQVRSTVWTVSSEKILPISSTLKPRPKKKRWKN